MQVLRRRKVINIECWYNTEATYDPGGRLQEARRELREANQQSNKLALKEVANHLVVGADGGFVVVLRCLALREKRLAVASNLRLA